MNVNMDAMVRAATKRLMELTGLKVSSVTGAVKEGDVWRITLEMIDKKSIPDSMDVLATYEVRMGPDGEMLGFTRGRLRKRGDTTG